MEGLFTSKVSSPQRRITELLASKKLAEETIRRGEPDYCLCAVNGCLSV
jgi:hypothetical protein